MDALQARISSFKKSKRVKNPSKPSSSTTLKWPHPPDFKANPETLAEAGFYYDPSYDDPDNVTCYMCDKELGGWEEDDDPFVIHYSKCSQTCCWASARCGILMDMDEHGKFVSTDKARIPTHKQMEKARHDTFLFGKGWKHDKVPNHGANSKMMARAGFVFTPQHGGDDLATCFYCDTSLSGWEPEDDPIEEHRKRESKTGVLCSFFTSSLNTSSSTKPSSKSQIAKPSSSKPASKSTSGSKHQDIVQPTKTHDGALEDDDSGDDSAGKATYTKTPHKGRPGSTRKSSAKTKAKSKARSSSRTGLKNVVEEEEEEDYELAPQPITAKKSRSTSKSVAKATVVSQTEPEDEDDEPPGPPITAKKSRSTSKSIPKAEVISQAEPEEEEVESRKPSRSRTKKVVSEPEEDVPRKSSRSKTKQSSVIPSSNEEEVTRKPSRSKSKARALDSEQEPVTAKPKHKRTASRSKSKAPIPVQVSEIESDIEPEITTVVKKVSLKKPKAPPQVPAAQNLFDDDVFTDHYVPAPPPSPPVTVKQNPVELPPLFVPKRNNKTVVPLAEIKDSVPLEKEKKKSSKPKSKPQPSTRTSDEELVKIHHKVSTDAEAPSTLYSSKVSSTSSSTGRPAESMEVPTVRPEQKMKVVEISSDEEDVEPPPKREQAMVISQSEKENSSGLANGQSAAQPLPVAPPNKEETSSEPSSTRSNKGTKAVVIEVAKPTSKSTPLRRSPSPKPASPVINPDVSMEYVGLPATESRLEPERDQDVNMLETPVTPPRQTAQARPASFGNDRSDLKPDAIVEDKPTAEVEPPFIPALSKLPFIPLNSLSEGELDMTVEEWIRYQMEVEYDKFRRDGERELQRFRKRAEEVRKVIEGL